MSEIEFSEITEDGEYLNVWKDDVHHSFLVEDNFTYGISVNGKLRTEIVFSASATNEEIQNVALSNEIIVKWLEGNSPKKVIVVPKKIVNIVV